MPFVLEILVFDFRFVFFVLKDPGQIQDMSQSTGMEKESTGIDKESTEL